MDETKAQAQRFDALLAESDNRTDQDDRLRPLPMRTSPRVFIWPSLHRSMREVDPKLVALFRELAAGQKPWPLFIHGPVGSGKSFSALSLCDFIETAVYLTVDELSDLTMAGEPRRGEMLSRIERKDLVVLDELGGRDRVGDLEYSSVKNVLDMRHRIGGALIAISNHSPGALTDLYDKRIVSRLTAGTVFQLDGHDRRADR